jgi:penicillin amidase
VIGAGEPGLPGVALGHNEHVAWGFTIVGTDTSDLFVLETDPKDPDRYRYGDGWEAMTIVRETAHVRSGRDLVDVDLILPFSKLGPVIARDSARNRAVALRWVGSQAGGAAYLGSLALGRVKNADEFVAALSRWKVPGLNMVHADTAGNIGWVAAGSVPVRKGFDGLLPAPGDGRFGWQGFLDLKDLPQTRNPDSHFVATANHNILPAGYAREISYEWSPDTRIRRIRDRLAAKPKFDLDDFRSIQHDDVSIPGRRLAALCRALPAPDELKPFVKLIAEWDGSLNVDTRAGTVYAAWWAELTQAFFRRHVPERLVDFVRGGRGVELMLTALESADPYWFADGSVTARDELLRTTLAAALQKLRTVHKVEPGNTPWGDLHTVTFRHPLSGLRPDFAEAFNVGPLRRSGDVFTPNNTRHDENFKQVHGASYRHVLDLADWDRGLATNAPGQSGRPGSPHYGDLAGPWSRGEYFPLAFSRAAVERVTAHRMTLKPGR